MYRTLRDLYFHLTAYDGTDCLPVWFAHCKRNIHKILVEEACKTATLKIIIMAICATERFPRANCLLLKAKNLHGVRNDMP
jgi:hypothetical protein